MTTQEQFEETRLRIIGVTNTAKYTHNNEELYADLWVQHDWVMWQACQDLNNAERESLIEENAMMREVLNKITKQPHNAGLACRAIADKALSVTPKK